LPLAKRYLFGNGFFGGLFVVGIAPPSMVVTGHWLGHLPDHSCWLAREFVRAASMLKVSFNGQFPHLLSSPSVHYKNFRPKAGPTERSRFKSHPWSENSLL